jgi:hypothetical protein
MACMCGSNCSMDRAPSLISSIPALASCKFCSSSQSGADCYSILKLLGCGSGKPHSSLTRCCFASTILVSHLPARVSITAKLCEHLEKDPWWVSICKQTISSGLSEIGTTGHDVSKQVVSMNKTISQRMTYRCCENHMLNNCIYDLTPVRDVWHSPSDQIAPLDWFDQGPPVFLCLPCNTSLQTCTESQISLFLLESWQHQVLRVTWCRWQSGIESIMWLPTCRLNLLA